MRKLVSFMAFCVLLFGLAITTSAEAYEVKKGDNLWRIAKDHQTTVSRLMEINELKSIIIYPKQMIELGETYVVEKGDTLSHIGVAYNVTVEELKEWNDLTSDLILVNQELKIYPEKSVLKEKSKKPNNNANRVGTPKKTSQNTTAQASAKESSSSTKSLEGKTMSVVATAYTAECDGCTGITYTGIDLNKDRNAKVIAVDPNVIPLGTEVYVEGYGHAIAGDIGGAIKGNRIDIHVPTKKEAYDWGVREVEITILDN